MGASKSRVFCNRRSVKLDRSSEIDGIAIEVEVSAL
jgi:hypothetical protein